VFLVNGRTVERYGLAIEADGTTSREFQFKVFIIRHSPMGKYHFQEIWGIFLIILVMCKMA